MLNKNKFCIILLLILFTVFLDGCGGRKDWPGTSTIETND